jgi:hypothetical protein
MRKALEASVRLSIGTAAQVMGCGLLAALLAGPAATAAPAGTVFTYQGRLQDAGTAAGGTYDFRFLLYDAPVGGSQVGPIVNRDDVVVTNGLFTVALDFGAAAFAGNQRFLEIAIRPGASSGSYTTLNERQELQVSPHSAFSLTSPWSGITGKPAGFADGTDDDVLGGLGCTSGQVAKWNGSAWACAGDANGGGTVTSVGTGAGLTGGPVTGAGSLSIAPGGVTSGMIADGAVVSSKIAAGAVGAAQIDASQVQTRLVTVCPLGEYLRGVNTDGSVVCGTFSLPPMITTIDDPANTVGQYTSIAIGADGLPVISYQDATAGTLKVAKCANTACTGTSISTVDDPANFVGQYTSIAIGVDGLPVISYFDGNAGALKVAKCANATCTGTSIITTVDDPANSVGYYTSIAIGTDGLPVISYQDFTAGTLKVAKCVNAACTGTSISTVDDPANFVGNYTSIAIGADGLPVISYHDFTAGALKVAKCGNAACNGANTITTVDDPVNGVGFYTSIAIGADGLPVISYFDGSAGALKVAQCVNAACTGISVITTVDDPANYAGSYTSIAIGADGLPVISYQDQTAATLKVAKCVNDACTGAGIITTVDDPANFVGSFTSIAIGADGLPIISYFDGGAGALKVAKCNKPSCAP